MTTQLAVLGSPIAHSQSPALHAAAYGVLGLDWQYSAIEVTESALRGFIAGLGSGWRGLSLTMPLKREVLGLLDEVDPVARLTGGANTVLVDRGRLRGFNTDVYGITRAFQDAGVESLRAVRILGGGATAASALVAVHELGATQVKLSVRTPAKAAPLLDLAGALGVALVVTTLDTPHETSAPGEAAPDAVVSTLPGHADVRPRFTAAVRGSAVLFDVAYSPWPSSLASEWFDAGGSVISGIEMLIDQALAQVRIFVNGDPDAALDDEVAVLAAMRAAVGA